MKTYTTLTKGENGAWFKKSESWLIGQKKKGALIFDLVKEKRGKVLNRYIEVTDNAYTMRIYYDGQNQRAFKTVESPMGDLLAFETEGLKDKKLSSTSKIRLKNSNGEHVKVAYRMTNPEGAEKHYKSLMETLVKVFGNIASF